VVLSRGLAWDQAFKRGVQTTPAPLAPPLLNQEGSERTQQSHIMKFLPVGNWKEKSDIISLSIADSWVASVTVAVNKLRYKVEGGVGAESRTTRGQWAVGSRLTPDF